MVDSSTVSTETDQTDEESLPEEPVLEGDELRVARAEAAREVLLGTASRYHDVITYQALGAAVTERTGVHTKQLLQYWISDVLLRVARECAARDEPNLASLCVNNTGSVGEGYRAAVLAVTGEAPADPDDHAAAQRLACHRHFDAGNLPESGGQAALAPKLAASRSRARKNAWEAREIPLCPACNLALPANGVCDECA